VTPVKRTYPAQAPCRSRFLGAIAPFCHLSESVGTTGSGCAPLPRDPLMPTGRARSRRASLLTGERRGTTCKGLRVDFYLSGWPAPQDRPTCSDAPGQQRVLAPRRQRRSGMLSIREIAEDMVASLNAQAGCIRRGFSAPWPAPPGGPLLPTRYQRCRRCWKHAPNGQGPPRCLMNEHAVTFFDIAIQWDPGGRRSVCTSRRKPPNWRMMHATAFWADPDHTRGWPYACALKRRSKLAGLN